MDRRSSLAARERLAALIDDLDQRGILTDRRLHAALHEVPRHLFVPARGWASPQGWYGVPRPIDRAGGGSAWTDWWNAVYSDCSITTQADDGTGDPAAADAEPSSSTSSPSIVVAGLQALDVRDHDRVLEIGTGTGWTAGLLSWLVGEDRITSVEVDAAVAKQAVANLETAGFAPCVIVGDGAMGCPDGGPYDRVHVTCGIRDIPYAWIEQTRPGGIIVLPWQPGHPAAHDGHQLVLHVVGDGTAVGRFAGGASYMLMRSQRPIPEELGGDGDKSETRFDPRTLLPRTWSDEEGGAALTVCMLVPGLTTSTAYERGGRVTVRLSASGSWATCTYDPDAVDYAVRQGGERRLWNEVEGAYLRWLALGRPGRSRFGLTVTASGQRIWLDSPGSRLP